MVKVKINSVSFYKTTVTKDNYIEVSKQLDDLNIINTVCHNDKCVWLSVDNQDIKAINRDTIVIFNNNKPFVYSEKGYNNFLNEINSLS